MKQKLQLRDRMHEHDTITGYSRCNMVRRMWGSTAKPFDSENQRLDEPFTVVGADGLILGSAIFHEN